MATVTTILGLTALTTILSDDVVPVVDVHDTTQSPSGSTKKITVANLFAPYAPLSGATFTGALSGTTLGLSSTLTVGGAQVTLTADSAEVNNTFAGVTTTRFFTDAGGGAISVDGANSFRVKTGGKSGTVQFTVSPTTTTVAGALSVAGATTLAACSATSFSGPLTGNVTGNVSGSAGSVAAANITGTTLASGVTGSSLTSVGTLASLTVSGTSTLGAVNAQSLTATALQSSGSLSVQTDFAHKGSNAGFYNTTPRSKANITYPTTYTLGSFEQAIFTVLTNYGLLTTTQSGSLWVVS